jgi:hypothetical protein
MDQGIIKVINQWFRKKLVCQLLQQLKPGFCNYKLSILDALHFLTSVWEALDFSIIASCFKKAGFGSDITEGKNLQEDIYSSAWENLQENLKFYSAFESFISVDDQVLTCNGKVFKIYYLSSRLIKNQMRRRMKMKSHSDANMQQGHWTFGCTAVFCGEHLRGASTNMKNPLEHGELHSLKNRCDDMGKQHKRFRRQIKWME